MKLDIYVGNVKSTFGEEIEGIWIDHEKTKEHIRMGFAHDENDDCGFVGVILGMTLDDAKEVVGILQHHIACCETEPV